MLKEASAITWKDISFISSNFNPSQRSSTYIIQSLGALLRLLNHRAVQKLVIERHPCPPLESAYPNMAFSKRGWRYSALSDYAFFVVYPKCPLKKPRTVEGSESFSRTASFSSGSRGHIRVTQNTPVRLFLHYPLPSLLYLVYYYGWPSSIPSSSSSEYLR